MKKLIFIGLFLLSMLATGQHIIFGSNISEDQPPSYLAQINFGGNATEPSEAGWGNVSPWQQTLESGDEDLDSDYTIGATGITIRLIGSADVTEHWGFSSGNEVHTGSTGFVTGDDSGVFPDDILQHYFFVQNVHNGNGGLGAALEIRGIDNANLYTIEVTGSRDLTGSRESTYTIGGNSQTLEVIDNSANSITFTDIQPVSDVITMYLKNNDAADEYGYLNGMVITENTGAGDDTAPVLTLATGVSTGETTADGTVTTDEGNGTLYYLVTENSSEVLATVKAGSSQSVSTTGIQNVNVTGLTAATNYYFHYAHTDNAGNDSNVISSSQFTTDAGAFESQIGVWSSAAAQTTGTTAAVLDWDTEVRNDNSTYSNTSGAITLPQGKYFAHYQSGFIASDYNNRQTNVIRATLDNVEIEGSAGQGYQRNTNNDALWAAGSCIVDAENGNEVFRTEFFRDFNGSTGAFDQDQTYLILFSLDDGLSYGHYQPTVANETSTYANMTLGSTYTEEGTKITRSGSDITLAANTTYLVTGGVYFSSTSARTARFVRATVDNVAVAGSMGYSYMRDGSNRFGAPNTFSIIETGGSSETLRFQSRISDSDGGTPVTGSASIVAASSGFFVIELPSSFEYYSSSDATLAQGVGGSTVNLNFNNTVDNANANIVTSSTASSVTLVAGSYFVAGGIEVDRTANSGARLTREANFKLDGTNVTTANHGSYNRGDQGSQDVYDNTFNPRGYISASGSEVLTLTLDEDRDTAWDNGGGSPQTLNDPLGVYILKIPD